MILIGLTGGIGMGKSTAASLLEGMGLTVVDTDSIARQIVEPGQPALAEIRQTFGPAVIADNGALRRDELARIVFADDARRRQLESILHPRIRELWLDHAARWRAEGRPLGVVVIPLLFETAAEREFDRILCVACSAKSQRERLTARGWSAEEIERRIAAQWPVGKKMDLAHHVIWTEPSREVHTAQLERIIRRL
jgi:dephospho-CoA kinase